MIRVGPGLFHVLGVSNAPTMACQAAGPGAIFEYGLSGQVQEESCPSKKKSPERLKLHSSLCVIYYF